jgi:lipopolysaccharide export LptBFGC system permease protein LptF
MAGPYQQYSDPQLSQSNYSEPYPSSPVAAPSVYPGTLPPPVPYPGRRRWQLIAAILLIVAVVAGATTAVVFGLTSKSSSQANGQITEASAKTAIQSYLDAMQRGDTEAVARNTLCGFYDQIKDKRSDQALARLLAETFRKQFSQAQVTSIDKMVLLSENQAQVLFTMQVVPTSRGSQKRTEQATAQLLLQDGRLLVCQYLLRGAGPY